MKLHKIVLMAASAIVATSCTGTRQETYTSLQENFITPPADARPQVWWHWMNGNITREGLRKDLEWMHRAGIGGFHVFDAAMATPQIVDRRIDYMSQEFNELFAEVTALADSLGLEMTIASSPGFSESGGPWVAPEDGMKRLTWREMDVKGDGSRQKIMLPEPYAEASCYQNYPEVEVHWGVTKTENRNRAYGDIAVIAFPVGDDDASIAATPAKVTSSGGSFIFADLNDDDLQTGSVLPAEKPGAMRWIQYEFEQPRTIRAIQYYIDKYTSEGSRSQILYASNDGKQWQPVADLFPWFFPIHTVSFPEVTARFFKVEIPNSKDGKPSFIGSMRLYGTPMSMRSEERLGYWPNHFPAENDTPQFSCGISSESIIDITDCLQPDGTLNWKVPQGQWRIMRFGWSITGKVNHPASPEASGPEVDKMDGNAVQEYYDRYIDMYLSASGGMIGARGITAMLNDSYEAHGSTWSADLPVEFAKRSGYDLIKWLPAAAGYIIDNTQTTEAFIYDWGHTIGKMIVANHYDKLSDILKPLGMKRISESHEMRRAYFCDGMEVKRGSDIPMSALWVGNESVNPWSLCEADIRESASVSHIYGQKYVAAESFTAPASTSYSFSPCDLKAAADFELSAGITRFVIHESAHQPSDEHVPGLTLGSYGQWFNRHETWAEQARPWTDYLARSCYMLMQGRNVADVAWLYGERYNVTYFASDSNPLVPEGYAYDYINAETILKYSKIRKGRIEMPTGVSYRVVALDSSTCEMSVELLKALDKIASAGVWICGEKPSVMAGLSGDKAEFERLADKVWSRQNVVAGRSLADVLTAAGIEKDCAAEGAQIRFVHREIPGAGHIYWISNPLDAEQIVSLNLRKAGYRPMLWHAEDGSEEAVSFSQAGGHTSINLQMASGDAVFIVMAQPCSESIMFKKNAPSELLTVSGPWHVDFISKVYDSFSADFDQLQDLSKNTSDNSIRYFSGTASYRAEIILDKAPADGKAIIDLGRVCDLAEVIVNGQSQGIVWHAPYILAISGLKDGKNDLEIRVTNPWRNRLIGDAQPDAKGVKTFTSANPISPDSPLKPSGLIGPVRLLQ